MPSKTKRTRMSAPKASKANSAKSPKTAKSAKSAKKQSPAKPLPAKAAKASPLEYEVRAAIAWLKQHSTPKDRENLARFGIHTSKAIGVSMANIQVLGKRLGRRHELAIALWNTGWYEARMLTSFVDEPARVTPAQMERWAKDFDNWGIVDTVCFCLFDRTPHAWTKVAEWHDRREEFVKRAAFALIASLAGHDKTTGDAPFLESLIYIERGATDDRNFVKKGVSWALRRVGRRNATLNVAAVNVARRLADSPEPAARWVGRGALKELTSATVVKALARTAARHVG